MSVLSLVKESNVDKGPKILYSLCYEQAFDNYTIKNPFYVVENLEIMEIDDSTWSIYWSCSS